MEEKTPNKHTILLVDDDQFLRDMYSVKFREHGFEVETAESASEAFDQIKGGFAPDIILFDVVMPGMDGYGFLEKLKTENVGATAIKIALSNQGGDSDIEKAKSLGASDYIIKANTTPSEVVSRVLQSAGIQ